MSYPDNLSMQGRGVVEALADTYQQLFVAPGEGGREKYSEIVNMGQDAESRDLSHFHTSEGDTFVYEDTPAGKVLCVTLCERSDFVTFLRIIAHRCEEAPIPDSQGASIVDGVINWKKIRLHLKEFLKEEAEKGNPDPDTDEEFKRFTSDRNNYRDAIIILSVGPYSAIPASRVGIPEDEWTRLSGIIRKYHECTHFICRRKYPEKKNAIWDELVADAVGIYAAFNKYDPEMAKIFLGIDDTGYVGGRLENYVKDEEDTDRKETLDRLSRKILPVIEAFNVSLTENPGISPYEAVILLEERIDELWP